MLYRVDIGTVEQVTYHANMLRMDDCMATIAVYSGALHKSKKIAPYIPEICSGTASVYNEIMVKPLHSCWITMEHVKRLS
jgi:hypothetical protein